MNYVSIIKVAYLFAFIFLFLCSCGTPYQPEEEKEITDSNSVPPDGTLETVTWNLEWYGSGFGGPSDQEQQTKNIGRVLDSLNADLYAFQEINRQEDLNTILENMKGYRGFVADHIDQSQPKDGFRL